MKPAFITFTGVDDQTDLAALIALAEDYPVEYGVLFSPEREEPRYPSMRAVIRMLEAGLASRRTVFSAHLCGGYSRQLLAKAETDIDGLIGDYFHRAQVNTAHRGIDTAAMRLWALNLEISAILQCRDAFPSDSNVEWLYDVSGGRGVSPAAWPEAPEQRQRVGYAGGLNPDNVAAAVIAIGDSEGDYWIDMESGVRTDDRFDLAKCRAVCQAVYGTPTK